MRYWFWGRVQSAKDSISGNRLSQFAALQSFIPLLSILNRWVLNLIWLFPESILKREPLETSATWCKATCSGGERLAANPG